MILLHITHDHDLVMEDKRIDRENRVLSAAHLYCASVTLDLWIKVMSAPLLHVSSPFPFDDLPFPLDVWSAGCVLAELLLGQPIFPGDSGVDQLVEIIKVMTGVTHRVQKPVGSGSFSQVKSKFRLKT